MKTKHEAVSAAWLLGLKIGSAIYYKRKASREVSSLHTSRWENWQCSLLDFARDLVLSKQERKDLREGIKRGLCAILVLAAVLTAGCVSSQSLVTGKARSAVSVEQVELRPSPPAGAEEIGIVTAATAGHSQHAMAIAVDALKKKAGAMGANIIVVIGSDLAQHESSGGLGYSFGAPGVTYTPSMTSRETKVQAKAYYAKTN